MITVTSFYFFLLLFSVVLIEGLYGEGYDASTFIYQGF